MTLLDLVIQALEAQRQAELQARISTLLASTDANLQWQGRTIQTLLDAGVPIEAVEEPMVDPVRGNILAQPDLETEHYVVEMTYGTGRGKVGQAQRTMDALNRFGDVRQVVVYGPNLDRGVANELTRIGVSVVRTEPDLISRLGGDPAKIGYL